MHNVNKLDAKKSLNLTIKFNESQHDKAIRIMNDLNFDSTNHHLISDDTVCHCTFLKSIYRVEILIDLEFNTIISIQMFTNCREYVYDTLEDLQEDLN